MPQVSIITPCYNSARYVAQTIESVQSQTVTDWEHIVVDDGSTDESAAVVRMYMEREPRMQLVEQANSGVSRARNVGYRAASPDSKYLMFLDADDCLDMGMLATLMTHLEAHPEAGMAYCKARCINEEGDDLEGGAFSFAPRRVPNRFGLTVLPETATETPFVSIFALCGLCPSLVLFRRAVCDQAGEWDEALTYYEDTDMFLRVALCSQVHYLPLPLVRYRRHPSQATGSETSREHEATQRAKFYAKWNLKDLEPTQQTMLNQARAFREGRVVPLSGLQAGKSCLMRRQWRDAIRFLGGAARRYIASLL